jgi:hypothetical protein
MISGAAVAQLLLNRVECVLQYSNSPRSTIDDVRISTYYFPSLSIMTALIDALARCIRGTYHGVFSSGDALPKQPAHSKPRYVRARSGGRKGVYRVLEKRKDNHRKTVKRYKKVRDGPKVHFEEGPDEWTASREETPQSRTPYRKPRHASADIPHNLIPVRINRKGSIDAQGVDIVATSRSDIAVGNPTQRKATKDDRKERSAKHKTHLQSSRPSIRRELQSMTHERTVIIVENQEENGVTSGSYSNDTSYPHDIHSTPPSSGSPTRRPRLTGPFQQPQMTTRESEAMVFGRNAQIPSKLSGSHSGHARNVEYIIEPDDGLRGRLRSRQRGRTPLEAPHAMFSGLERHYNNND